MLYNLRSGKTIEMSVEEFFRLSDDDFRDLDTLDAGEIYEHPFTGSALLRDAELFAEKTQESLLTISPDTKLMDAEFMRDE